MLASGLVCPCHVLVGVIGLLVGVPMLSPAVQDGIHAVYLPAAVLIGAVLLTPRLRRGPRSTSRQDGGPP
jgi:hypothetical protein